MCREIFLDAPNLGDLEKEYLNKAIDSNYVSTVGPFVPEFEQNFADYLGVKTCISTQSGTAAIHMALYELGIKEGDEVIVPAITFIATANPILYLGATPVIVDIDPETWCIDPQEVEKAITPRTKVIIPVHLYGNPCNMDELMRIAEQYGLYIIEDATESLGATYKGRFTGTFGEFGCFSFNGNKVITTGGGGMIATNDKKRGEHLRFLVNQARDVSCGYYHPEVGFNYRMTNLEAALGLAQFQRLKGFITKKIEFHFVYERVFMDTDVIELQKTQINSTSSYWINSIVINTNSIGKTITEIQQLLKEKRIQTRRIFHPLIDFPPYYKYKTSEYPVSYRIFENGLNLPSSTLNEGSDIRETARNILKVLGAK